MISPATLLAAAAVAIALALQISSGFYDGWALALVALATAAAICGAVWRSRGAPERGALVAQALLGAGSAAGLGFHLFANPTSSGDARAFQGGFRWFALVSLVALSAYLCIHLRASLIRARFLLVLLCFAVMGIVALRASQPMARHGGAETWIDAVTVVDARYAFLVATIAGAWLLARAWPGNAGELAATLVLFQPRTLFVLEQGWAEPVVFFCFALAVFAIARQAHPGLVAGALGLLAASTPVSLFLVIPLGLALPRWRRLFAGAAALIAVGAGAFWLLSSPQAPRGLSLAPLVPAPGICGAVFGAAVLLLCLRRGVDLPLACGAAGAALSAVLLFKPDSFANAWWLCAGLLAAACPVPAPRVAAVLPRRPPETLATAAGAG